MTGDEHATGQHADPRPTTEQWPRAPIPDSPPMPPRFGVTFDDIEAGARRALEQMQSTSEKIAAVRVTHSDDDEMVTVTVDGVGTLVDLRLSDSAMSLAPDALADLVVRTAADGAGHAFAQTGAHITALMASTEE